MLCLNFRTLVPRNPSTFLLPRQEIEVMFVINCVELHIRKSIGKQEEKIVLQKRS